MLIVLSILIPLWFWFLLLRILCWDQFSNVTLILTNHNGRDLMMGRWHCFSRVNWMLISICSFLGPAGNYLNGRDSSSHRAKYFVFFYNGKVQKLDSQSLWVFPTKRTVISFLFFLLTVSVFVNYAIEHQYVLRVYLKKTFCSLVHLWNTIRYASHLSMHSFLCFTQFKF